MSEQQQPQTGEVTITYNRATGEVQISGGYLISENTPLPIQTEQPVTFEAILIYHPGCIWYRGRIYC